MQESNVPGFWTSRIGLLSAFSGRGMIAQGLVLVRNTESLGSMLLALPEFYLSKCQGFLFFDWCAGMV